MPSCFMLVPFRVDNLNRICGVAGVDVTPRSRTTHLQELP